MRTSTRVDWLDGFADAIASLPTSDETAVTKAHQRQASILDDIRSIVSKAPVYSSVQDKVDDLKRRVGLDEYTKLSSLVNEIQSSASISPDVMDMVKVFVKNKIETHHGYIHLPALQQAILETFQQRGVGPGDVEDPEFERYLFDQLEEAKSHQAKNQDYQYLGKGVGISPDQEKSNNDFFGGLSPAKV